MNSSTIIVLGGANMDLVTRVPRIPKPGESVIGDSFQTVPGGKGANQAVAAARLGSETFFLGCVGDDAFGEALRDSMQESGVNVSGLKTHPTDPTGTAAISVSESGENAIAVAPSANFGLTPDDVRAMRSVFERADAMVLQLELPLETVEAALDLARECGVLSVLDAGPAQALAPKLLRKADIVSPNETEAEALTGISADDLGGAKKAAEALLAMGVGEVVVKMGAQGSLYVSKEDSLHVPPFSIAPVDTTAAGDAFTAALACAWKALPHAKALSFANAAGALAATKAGAQPSMPTLSAVNEFLNANQ